jgi:hypothetical protein
MPRGVSRTRQVVVLGAVALLTGTLLLAFRQTPTDRVVTAARLVLLEDGYELTDDPAVLPTYGIPDDGVVGVFENVGQSVEEFNLTCEALRRDCGFSASAFSDMPRIVEEGDSYVVVGDMQYRLDFHDGALHSYVALSYWEQPHGPARQVAVVSRTRPSLWQTLRSKLGL